MLKRGDRKEQKMENHLYNNQSFRDRRKELRKNQTKSEKVLWNKLRNKKLDAYKFFRQYSVGPYILDFYCPLLRLNIEIDGGYHLEEKEYDEERERFLAGNFIKTIRFKNEEVMNNLENVLKVIKENANVLLCQITQKT